MDELHELASALEEPEASQDIDDLGAVSATSSNHEREMYRKRRTRKRRTLSCTNANIVTNLLNNLVVVKHINNSPRSSSSIDEAVKDYVESLTANCSDESDEYVSSLKSKLKNAMLSNNIQDRIHHRRVFKQATPCCCESDSFTENGSAIPVLRKHKKKRIKRMMIDSAEHEDDERIDSNRKKKIVKTQQNICSHETETDVQKMKCKTTKTQRERKSTTQCFLCRNKPCREGYDKNMSGLLKNDYPLHLLQETKLNHNLEEKILCGCRCHTAASKEESSISSTSSNSDTDSANFTQDDAGGEGDDEMTDFYAESENGPVWGVPAICRMPLGMKNNSNEDMFLHSLEDSEWNHAVADGKFKRIVNGSFHLSDLSKRGFHARNNRLPGMAARSMRRGRRKSKLKKAHHRDKGSKDQETMMDFHSSLSKLSLSAKTKRRKLEDTHWREAFTNHSDFPPQRIFNFLRKTESASGRHYYDINCDTDASRSSEIAQQDLASSSSAVRSDINKLP